MLERKPLQRNETYVLPNTCEQDWELIISDEWHIRNKNLWRKLATIEKELDSAGISNVSLTNELITELKLLSKYPYPYFINTNSVNRIENIIINACNLASLDLAIRIELAKSFSLQVGSDEFLKNLNFSSEEKKIIAAYADQEVEKFFFPDGFDQDKLIKHVESIQDENELQKFAYDFLGYHRGLSLTEIDSLKRHYQGFSAEDENKYKNVLTPDPFDDIELVKKEIIEKIKIVVINFKQQGFSHLTKLPEGFLNNVISEICKDCSTYSNETDFMQIGHGGGFFHLLDFFTGKSNGYDLEKVDGKSVGCGIQVSPIGHEREKTYAYYKRPMYLDQPAILYAEISKNRLHKAPNSPREAGLIFENKHHLKNIKLYNLMTNEILEADNFDQLLQKIKTRNTVDYHPKIQAWNPSLVKSMELKSISPVETSKTQASEEKLIDTTPTQTLALQVKSVDSIAAHSNEEKLVNTTTTQAQIINENTNLNEALERFQRLKERILKEFNQNINEKELLDFIKQIKFAKDNGSISLLNNLSALAEVSFAAEKPNELASAATNTWLHSMMLTYRILNRPHNQEEIQLLTNALENATNIVKNPANLNAPKQLLIEAEKIRTKIEGGFFDRKESRIWKGLLYGALFLVMGGAMLAGAIIAAPLTVTVGTITAFVVLLNYLMAGSGLAGIFTGFCAPFVALNLSKESPDQYASRMAAGSMRHLVKSQNSFFKKNKSSVATLELENPISQAVTPILGKA